MSGRERVLRFGPGGDLVGILGEPDDTPGEAARSGVIFLNAGLIHRVGPGRQYVELARHLVGRGWVTFRLDHSGIGDSAPRDDALPAEKAAVHEAIAAMDVLAREAGCTRFVLLGMCAGTGTAFQAACADRRVMSLVLLNALLADRSVADEASLNEMTARKVAHSYVNEKLFRPRSWMRVLTGKTSPRRILAMLWRARRSNRARTDLPPDPDSARVLGALQGLTARATRVLFVYGELTGVRQYFGMTLERHLPSLDDAQRIDVQIVEHGDHSFTSLALQAEVRERVSRWLGDPPPPDPTGSAPSAAAPPPSGYTVPRRRRVAS